jgi:uncharacterized membrane protein YdjX (TVP38/TMEM64 family)
LNAKLKIVAGCVVLSALVFLLSRLRIQDELRSLLRWIEGLGAWGAVLFIATYIAGSVLFIPGWLLTLGAGIVFGVARGTVLVSIASTLGATAAFLVGRYFARDWVARKIEANPRFKAIDDLVAREGWKIVGLTRLSPVLPFTLLNYAFSLTRVSLRDYFLATWIGMLPVTVVYVYVGSLLGDLSRLNNTERTKSAAEWAFYAVGLVVTAAVTIYLTRLARSALARRIDAEPTTR